MALPGVARPTAPRRSTAATCWTTWPAPRPRPRTAGGSWDIAGPDVMTYGDHDRAHLRRHDGPPPGVRLGFTLTPVASVVAAAVAGEDPALIGPLMESLEHDLLPRDDTRGRRVRRPPARLRRRRRARAARVGAHRGAGGPVTAVSATIDIAVPPERVWDVIMDPEHFGDWVTIHRKLGHVDDGPLGRASASTRRSPPPRELPGALDPRRVRGAPTTRSGRARARPAPTPASSTAHAARRRRADALRLPQRVLAARRLPRPHGRPRARGGIAEREANRSLERLKAFLER